MDEHYSIDIMQSRRLKKRYPMYAREKKCYENIYNLVFRTKEFDACCRGRVSENAKIISYGYVKTPKIPYAVRHAFLIVAGKVIDPTIIEEDSIYYVIDRMDYREYNRRLLHSEYFDLHNDKELRQKERILILNLMQQGIVCVG